jgi:hypothetical protein
MVAVHQHGPSARPGRPAQGRDRPDAVTLAPTVKIRNMPRTYRCQAALQPRRAARSRAGSRWLTDPACRAICATLEAPVSCAADPPTCAGQSRRSCRADA